MPRPSPRWPARLALAALLLPALTSACAADPAWSPAVSSPSGGTSGTPTPAPAPTDDPEITIAFGGDVHFADRTLPLLDDPATAFGPVADVFTRADLAMINLETAVTTRGTEEPKRFHFRAPATAYQAVQAAGIDVVSIANNHALDYGRQGLLDTLDLAAQASVPTVGAGRTAAEAYRPWLTEIKGVRIAVLGFSQVAELAGPWAAKDDRPGIAMAFDKPRAVAAVAAARASADVVVVYVHWGREGSSCPTSQMKQFARDISAAGATMIVGTHAHLLLGDGWQGRTYVQYGLGNFLWWRNDASSNDTGVLEVTLRGGSISATRFVPAYIDRKTGQPKPVDGAEAQRITKKYQGLHSCTGLAAKPS